MLRERTSESVCAPSSSALERCDGRYNGHNGLGSGIPSLRGSDFLSSRVRGGKKMTLPSEPQTNSGASGHLVGGHIRHRSWSLCRPPPSGSSRGAAKLPPSSIQDAFVGARVSTPLPHDINLRFALTSSNPPPYHPSRSTDHVANIVGLFCFSLQRGPSFFRRVPFGLQGARPCDCNVLERHPSPSHGRVVSSI
jgi:hypothetical protein